MDAQIRPEPGAAGAQANQRISGRAVLLSLGVLLANIVVNGLIFLFSAIQRFNRC